MMKKTELLAPAGDMETLKTALRFGADAVYIGGPFMQLRAEVSGFSEDEIKEAVKYTHSFGKKLYVTVNSFAKNEEIEPLGRYAKRLYEAGGDAVIVSDIGALCAIRNAAENLEIHISTQANCQNYASALAYYKMGAKRVVTAREMTLSEIAEMRKKLPDDMEIEAFAHGAMCMSYSGRCFLSPYLSGRSGNRGECTQPCRWSYHITEMKRPGEFFQIEETEGGTNILSSRDMNCMDIIDDMIAAGITSFKIEGRMKTPYYVATVVSAYRKRLDGCTDLTVLNHELDCISHRPYCTGFYLGQLKKYRPDEQVPYISECTFAGTVKAYENGVLTVEQRGKFSVGDALEIVSPDVFGKSFKVEEIINSEGKSVQSAPHAQETVKIPCPFKLSQGDILRVPKK